MPESRDLLLVCESSKSQYCLSLILKALDRGKSPSIHVEGRPLSPKLLLSRSVYIDKRREGALSYIHKQAKRYRAVLIVFDLEFGGPLQPAPDSASLSELWLAPAVPSVESWVLTDPEVYGYMQSSGDKQFLRPFQRYVEDRGFQFFNTHATRRLRNKQVSDIYDPFRAAMLSPSLREFIRTYDKLTGFDDRTIDFTLDKATVARLIAEYYPSNLPIFRSLGGEIYSGQRMVDEVRDGTDLGRQYTSELLRVCRDILARQAQKYSVGDNPP